MEILVGLFFDGTSYFVDDASMLPQFGDSVKLLSTHDTIEEASDLADLYNEQEQG